jgi:hypothetical protein
MMPADSISRRRRQYPFWIAVFPVLLVSAFCRHAAGQNPAVQLAAAREAYSSSVEIWAALQQDLPAELKKLPTADAQAKLQSAEKARSAVSKARLDYLNGLKSAYSAAAGRYKAPADPRIEAKASIAGADKELLLDLDQATARLDDEIRSVAATDRARAAALQKQKAGLLDLRSPGTEAGQGAGPVPIRTDSIQREPGGARQGIRRTREMGGLGRRGGRKGR